MRARSNIVLLLAALTLFGCAGANQQQAKAPETNPWADYKGTYGAGGSQVAEEEPAPAKTDDSKPTKTASKSGAREKGSEAKTAKASKVSGAAEPAPSKKHGGKKGGPKRGVKSAKS